MRLGALLVVCVALVSACVQTTEPISNTLSQIDISLIKSLDTVYYQVTGQTTQDIFASMEMSGPKVDDLADDRFAAGLTELQSTYSYEFAERRSDCSLQSVTINISLLVTLPQHSTPELLSQSQLIKWRAYVESVAAHEQKHVDIHVARYEAFQETIDNAPVTYSDCDLLQSYLGSAWETESALDDQQQQDFHDSEKVRLKELNAPLQTRIDINQVKLDEFQARLTEFDQQIAVIDDDVARLVAPMSTYKSPIDAIRLQYPDLVLPPDIYDDYSSLLSEWNLLNDERNQLITDRNDLVQQRHFIVGQFNLLSEETNQLNDELVWVAG